MKIALLGDSHAGSLIAAVRERSKSDFSYSCFAAPRNMMGDVKITEGVLKATNPSTAKFMDRVSGQGNSINLSEYDCFLLCGMGISIVPLIQLYTSHQLAGRRLASDGNLISEPALRTALGDWLEGTVAVKLAKLLQTATIKPVALISRPIPTVDYFALNPKFSWFSANKNKGTSSFVTALYLRTVRELCERFGILFVGAPAETLSDQGLTKTLFAANVRNLQGIEKGTPDGSHMNKDFGTMMISEFEKKMRSKN